MNTKRLLQLGIFLFLSFAVNAQSTDWGWDWKDSSKISAKNMPQYNEFRNNNFPYPPKPKSQWELGLAAGISNIFGDVKSKIGYGGGLSVEKHLVMCFH